MPKKPNKRTKHNKEPPKLFKNNLEDSEYIKGRIKTLTTISYATRIIFIIYQCVCNYLIEDHVPDAFIYPRNKYEEKTVLDKLVEFCFAGFLRWDAQYFIFISKEGHLIEKSCAFFPFYPLLVSFSGNVIYFVSNGHLTFDNSLLVGSIILNVIIFKYSVIVLYKLSMLFFDEKFAFKSAILFIFNPATVFFIAPYSEVLFSLLTFWSIYSCATLYKKAPNFEISDAFSVIPLMLGPFTRSNGLVNLGFAVYSGIAFFNKNRHSRIFLQVILSLGIIFCISVAPFFAYQEHIHYLFCNNILRSFPNYVIEFAQKNDDVVLIGQYNNQSYCESVIFPLPYLYIQKKYWDVGFLGYYKFRKIPNFMLAMPIIFVMFYNIFKHIFVNYSKLRDDFFSTIFDWKHLDISKNEKLTKNNEKNIYKSYLNVFVVHGLFLSTFCLLFVHIEVSTRMICSSTPLIYWYCSYYIESTDLFKMPKKPSDFFIYLYFLSYIIVGIALFSNFYPWT